MELALSLGWMACVCWLILRAVSQRHLFPVLEPAAVTFSEPAPRLAVIVPARNEAANLGRCLRGLLDQHYPAHCLTLIVVDDHSTDETLAIASSLAARFSHLMVAECPPLPPGWVGKSHACWIGTNLVPTEAEWLCFIDADVESEPDLLASAVGAAASQQLDLLSLAPRQCLGSFAERLIIPCGLYLMAFCQDLALVQSQRSEKVTATGQFLLVRRRTYDEVGGHAAVHDAICEDTGLALLIKKAGGHVVLRNGRLLLSARMYTGWSSLWTGISKNLVEMLGGRSATLLIAALAFALSWMTLLVPAADGISCAKGISAGISAGCYALFPAIAASAAAFGLHIAGALYFRIPLWYGLLFPLGYTIGACIGVDSVRRRWRRAIVWKGRTYP
jgi:chlorobactene glucosyltransferase